MDEIQDIQDHDGIGLDLVALHEDAHDDQVEHKQNGISSGDPPINSCLFWSEEIKGPLDDKCVEGSLLHCCLDSDVRKIVENTDHDDETLSSRVGES